MRPSTGTRCHPCWTSLYKKPERLEGSVSVSLLGASAYVGIATKKLTWTNGIRYKTNQYLLGTLDTKGEYDPRYIDYQTYLNWTPSKRWEVGVIGNISENRYNFQPEDRYTRFGTSSAMYVSLKSILKDRRKIYSAPCSEPPTPPTG